MPRQIVHGALSVLTLVVASSAWAAPAPWVPNTTGNVGPAPTTFNKWEAIEAPAASGASCGNGSPYRFFVNRTTTTDRKFNRMRPSMARVLGLETRSAKEG
ncbi:MAG: hypothetical protein KA375_17195 [Vitreoscilla sp.]|jgi:hypothetical protein|uniref:Uncharacterized protein n=1 Tax=Comamonas denitrificans TaxID=117506 RepID=A0A939GX86_9BURK|nr:hypothetical protein [Comamonas denitrificans]MBP6339341.1 hypothetical protein [Vitreoscilla sp.]MBP6615310.1 hypothetical protein [Aquabacterium sp.]MBP8225222.1 hypothetical protein [Acidovorax sp.]MBP9953827.1 hypothetical protein [Ottowia sp.]MBO1250760.1 hypothetical protein [Comamonas denitrificans]